MTQIDDNIKYGMIEAISHLIHRDYEAIVEDFVTLDFIPPGTDLQPILPVLAKVFDQALEGGGAKNINFQELAADLAQITFDYPFRIPPYFALIIRAIGVLEGIALVGDPEFALVDEAFPYISKRLMTDDSPRLREALRYMVYGQTGVFDADRLIDLLDAFEAFNEASRSARGQLDLNTEVDLSENTSLPGMSSGAVPATMNSSIPAGNLLAPLAGGLSILAMPLMALNAAGSTFGGGEDRRMREALKFLLAPEGAFFRNFLLEEAVKSVDALSRNQFRQMLMVLGLQDVLVPVLVPGAVRRMLPIAPPLDKTDQVVVNNAAKLVNFLAGGNALNMVSGLVSPAGWELLPYLPGVAAQLLPQFSQKLLSRIAARAIREVFVG